jgi:ParB family transcriptional regulator, chromosome partitioning protein
MARTVSNNVDKKNQRAVPRNQQDKKISDLQRKIDKLRVNQSPQLEAEIKELQEKLKKTTGELKIDISLIDANPKQPRQTITKELIQAKSRLIKKYGQITPIILVAKDNNRYLILDGQLRYEAAKLLEWKTIRAFVVPMPSDLEQFSLQTFLGFEDLNPLDKATAIAQEVQKAINLSHGQLTGILSTIIKRIERLGKIKELAHLVTVSEEEQVKGLERLEIKDEEQKILMILLELGLNPASVKTNLLPMLSLPSDLQIAIRQKGLKAAHALTLSRISAKALNSSESVAKRERSKATNKVLIENLTVPETRDIVKSIKDKYLKPKTYNLKQSREINGIIQKMNSLSIEFLETASEIQLKELKDLLQQKLVEIDNILN